MITKFKIRRFNRSVKRLHKQGAQNMVDAYDIFNHIYYHVKPHQY